MGFHNSRRDFNNPIINHLQEQPNFKYKKDGGGTYPSCFIKKLPRDETGIILTIINDGQVSNNEVKKCEDLLNENKIKFSDLNVFYIGPEDKMNLSVVASFLRGERISEKGMVYNQYINDSYKNYFFVHPIRELKKYFDNLTLFLKEADKLAEKFDLQNLGRTNQNKIFRDELAKLKNNLLDFILKKDKNIEKTNPENIEKILKNLKESKDTDAINNLNNLIDNNQNLALELDTAFKKLFVALDRKDGYNFNRNVSNTHTMTTTVQEVPINELSTALAKKETTVYVCPITLNVDVPILPARNVLQKTKTPNPSTCDTKDQLGPKYYAALDNSIIRDLILKRFKQENFPLKEEISKDKLLKLFEQDKHAKRLVSSKASAIDEFIQRFKTFYLNNPIAFLYDNDLVKQIEYRLDNIIGLDTIHFILDKSDNNNDKNNFISPTTNQRISSFISPSNVASHIKNTHYAITDLFFGEQTCYGERSLWLAILYLIIKKQERFNAPLTEYQDPNDSVKTNEKSFALALKERVIDQLCTDETNLTLSNLPEHGPILKVPVALALWYCVRSPQFIKDFRHNRLRSIGTKYHLELLDELNFPYDKEWTIHQLARYKLFAWMMDLAKEDPKKSENWLRSFYQKSINCDGTLVFLDGVADYDLNTLKIGIFENNGYDTKGSPTFFINEEDQKNKIVQNTHFIDALSPAEVFALYKLVDTTKKTEDIDIDSRIDNLLEDQSLINSQLPKPETHYNLEYSRIKSIEDDPTQVCPFTLRPYRDANSLENSIKTFGLEEKQLFAYKYFSNFVKQFKKFPTTHELLIYMAEKQSKKADSKNTLPATDINFAELITNIISKFKEAMAQLLLNKDKLQNILNVSPLIKQSKKDEFKFIFNEFNGLAKQSNIELREEKEIAHQPEKIKDSKEANSPSNPFEINIDKIIELLEKNKIVLQPEDITLIRNNKTVACQKFGKFEIEILDGIMKLLNQKNATLQPKDIQTILAIIKTKPCGYQKCDKYKIEIFENMLELLKQNEIALQLEDIHTIQAIINTVTTSRRKFNEFKIDIVEQVTKFLKQKGVQPEAIQALKKSKTTASKKIVQPELINENNEICLFNRITMFFKQGGCSELRKQLEKAGKEFSKIQSTSKDEPSSLFFNQRRGNELGNQLEKAEESIPKNQSTLEKELLSMQNTYRKAS
ncbi:hypothetical protein [Rickettsiella endosymbiont of Xylota segnis]|uniref:hypothetical protein n=1 Tax=Rickettsiella endosymbiont of Xylota segnis TaxID=3066238 RepID=UPI0030CB0945